MKRISTNFVRGLIFLLAFQAANAQDNALVIANSKTRQFRHIKMNRWIKIKLTGGNRYHTWFMKGVNDSSIVMAHGHVILYNEITHLKEITEMHLALRFAAPLFFVPFGIVLYAVGLKDGKSTPLSRKISTYSLTGILGLAALGPWVIQPKEYDLLGNWYLDAGTMPKKLFKRQLKRPKGDGS